MQRLLPLAHLLNDPTIQEISINAGSLYIDRGSGWMHRQPLAIPPTNLHAVIRLLYAANGGYLDPDTPFVTVSLACGARFHAALQPVASEPQISIRTHRRILRPLSDFMGPTQIEQVTAAITQRHSIAIAGATSSGKTTLLNSVMELIPYDARILLIEDAPEIQLSPGRNVVWRRASGAANIRRHVFEALRDRPDWLCVGETRDGSARDLLDASRSGHPGLSTVHAASAEGAITRLMSLANCDRQFVAEALQLILFIERMPDGRRTVQQIKEIA